MAPNHRRPYRRLKPVPRRPSMLDCLRHQVQAWLGDKPGIKAIEVLAVDD
jgi:hypothetical protein